MSEASFSLQNYSLTHPTNGHSLTDAKRSISLKNDMTRLSSFSSFGLKCTEFTGKKMNMFFITKHSWDSENQAGFLPFHTSELAMKVLKALNDSCANPLLKMSLCRLNYV